MADKKQKNEFLRQLPDRFIKELDGGNLSVTVPGSGMRLMVPAENRFPSADLNGNDVPKHSNIKLGLPGDELTVTMEDPESGNIKRETRTASQISNAWKQNQREYAEQKGPKVYMNGVSPKMIHESGVEMQDGTGRKLMQVSVADPESAPQPVRENGKIVEGKFRETGYGSFLVSPDAITPSSSNQNKVNIYLGHENDAVKGYQIFTGEYDESGKGKYEKVTRTAGEVKGQYESDLAAFKAKMAEKDTKAPEAAKANDGPEGPEA